MEHNLRGTGILSGWCLDLGNIRSALEVIVRRMLETQYFRPGLEFVIRCMLEDTDLPSTNHKRAIVLVSHC